MSRRNNRKNPHKTPPSERNRNGGERTYQFTEPPPPPPLTDFSRVWVGGRPNEPPPQGDGEGTKKYGFGSRGNSLLDGLRSRLLFPEAMKLSIDERTRDFAVQIVPGSQLEWWLTGQVAMGTVQGDLARDQLLVNMRLAVERVDTHWADDRRQRADKLGQRIATAPGRIARELGRSKYGAIYLLDQLTSIGESIASNGGLDDAQRECLFDHLGVDHVFRNGSQKVPAGNDGPGLTAAVEKEKARLTTKLERELNARDLAEQAAARLGIVRFYDQETRNLRGSETRADRRVKWALKTIGELRLGADPAKIIDPETKKPINAGAHASPTAEPAPPDPEQPTPPPAEPAAAAAPTSPFPGGCPEELKQIILLVGEAYNRKPASSGEETTEEPGSVLPV